MIHPTSRHLLAATKVLKLIKNTIRNSIYTETQHNYLMVLESLLNPKKARKRPWEVFLVAVLYSIVAVLLASALFPEQASILTIALITMMFVVYIQKLFGEEEEKDELIAEKKLKKSNIFERHKDVIVAYCMMFLGITVALTAVFIFLPQYGSVFDLQIAQPTISQYANAATAHATVSGQATASSNNAMYLFIKYVMNNSRVMILAFVLSALLGTGAIIVLAWNASVIAVFVGLKTISPLISGSGHVVAFLIGLPSGLLSIALHGIPEILAYVLAAIAGGILSVGIIREKIESNEFREVFKDALTVLVVAELVIILAAFLEAAL